MVRSDILTLPHGIHLHCRSTGRPEQPLLLFLHGFPEGAFIWDGLLEQFGAAFYCVAPDLRGYGQSSQPQPIEAYRPKALVQDLLALIEQLSPARPAACVVAHDWGGALAWNLANQHPGCMQQLLIINAPHPGSFLRELQHNPVQQAASQYMHFLRRPDAADLLLQDDGRKLFAFFDDAQGQPPAWLTPALRAQYLAHWRRGLHGPCAYYAASPLVPPRADDHSVMRVQLPDAMLHIEVPTHILWGEQDVALQPQLLDGLGAWIPHLQVQRMPGASHWLVHEMPQQVMATLQHMLNGTNHLKK